jgi:hypothetical protein
MRQTRRRLLRDAASVGALVALQPLAVRELAPGAASSTAWLTALTPPTTAWGEKQMSSFTGPVSLFGVDSAGRTAGTIRNVLPSITRDPTAALFVLPWSQGDGHKATTMVEVFDAASGKSLASVKGHNEPQGNADELSDGIQASFSSDGRWLVLMHTFLRETGDPGPKGSISSTYTATQILAVELIDLELKKSVDYLELEAVDRSLVVRDALRCAIDGPRAYVLGRRLAQGFSTVLWAFDIGRGRLSLIQHLTKAPREDERGRSLRPSPGIPAADWVFVAQLDRLVAYVPPLVRVFGLPELDLLQELEVGTRLSGSRFPPRSFPVFNSAGVVHLIDPSSGSAIKHDFVHGTTITSVSIPGASAAPTFTLGLPREAVVSTMDKKQLLLADNRLTGSGVWSLSATDLSVIGNWLIGHKVQALWPGSDGSVFALSRDENRAYVLDATGNLRTSFAAQGATTFMDTSLP